MDARRPTETRRREFEALVNAHDRDLRMLAFRLLGDADQMDAVLEEAYLEAYRSMPSFPDEPATRARLFHLVYDACVARLRDQTRISWRLGRAESLQTLADTGFEATAREAGRISPQDRRLEAALAALPFERRAAILLVDVFGFGYPETAKILGVREGALVSRLPSAREYLQGSLTSGGGTTR